ncbi:MAG TPA: RNA-binding protein [Hyphomicrobiaceae bacterium]|nr:RNA-binding protein [Hyphomicrobiaceae bacterium]
MHASRHTTAGLDGHTPARTCIVSRASVDPAGLIRFVMDPAGRVVPDLAGRLPGRGAWVDGCRDTVETAVRKGAFSRAFRQKIVADEALADRLDELLLKRTLQALSMANKAGLAVCGFGKVDDRLQSGRVRALLHASDASDGGAGRLTRKYQAVSREAGVATVIVTSLTIDQLGLAMGRSNVVHAALSTGRASDGFVSAAERLARYRRPSSTLSVAETPAVETLIDDLNTDETPANTPRSVPSKAGSNERPNVGSETE